MHLCLNLTAYMLNSCRTHPFPSGTGPVAMIFPLTGVLKNVVIECGNGVGVNPQVPNLLKMFLKKKKKDVSSLSVSAVQYFGVECH